jgi:hypothetical protein
MKRICLAVVVSMMVALTSITTMAAAATANNPCPTSPYGPGDVLQSVKPITMMVNTTIDSITVLKDGVDADVVCTSLSTGITFINDDGTVSYASGLFDLGTTGQDFFIVGAVKDGNYYTVSVPVNVFAVQLSVPTVIRKATVNKQGKVVKAALISFTNPTTEYRISDMVGDSNLPAPDATRTVAPNGTVVIRTKRLNPAFVQYILIGSGKATTSSLNSAGTINTLTGAVTMDNLWYSPTTGEIKVHNHDFASRWNVTN